jgi:cystathionine beta-lyase
VSPFDTLIDRRGSAALKWDKYAGRDILPMWVADMDFAAPPAVLEALQTRLEHGVFGYSQASTGLLDAIRKHLHDTYAWAIEAEWLVWLPGLVSGLNIACRSVDGDALTATPIYPPFLAAPGHAGRALQCVELAHTAAGWQWDMAALERAVTPTTRLFMLCHPHNPVGRCWRQDELQALAAFAERHALIVCADEIHCGLILDAERRHRPYATLSPATAKHSITLMAPSKTFNIPGLGCAFAVIPDQALRRRFRQAMEGIVPHVNGLGLVACEAAYRDAGEWQRDLVTYLAGNRDRLAACIAQIPGVSMAPVEATYLGWIDVRQLGLADPVAHFEAHGLGLSDGRDFGAPGWLRLNFGCPRSQLELALQRFEHACAAAR